MLYNNILKSVIVKIPKKTQNKSTVILDLKIFKKDFKKILLVAMAVLISTIENYIYILFTCLIS